MHLKLVSVGKIKDAAMRAAVDEYFKRLRRHYEVSWVEIKKESGNRTPEELTTREGERVLKAVGDAYLILLDEKGKLVDSRSFSERLRRLVDGGTREIAFVIGGPYGHAGDVRARADWVWSLSPLTFTHQHVPMLLAEQIYRADSILRGEPYHND